MDTNDVLDLELIEKRVASCFYSGTVTEYKVFNWLIDEIKKLRDYSLTLEIQRGEQAEDIILRDETIDSLTAENKRLEKGRDELKAKFIKAGGALDATYTKKLEVENAELKAKCEELEKAIERDPECGDL